MYKNISNNTKTDRFELFFCFGRKAPPSVKQESLFQCKLLQALTESSNTNNTTAINKILSFKISCTFISKQNIKEVRMAFECTYNILSK